MQTNFDRAVHNFLLLLTDGLLD